MTEDGSKNAGRERKARDLVDRLVLGPCDSRFGQYLFEFFCRLPDDAFGFFESRGPATRVIQPAMNTFAPLDLPQDDSKVSRLTLILFVSNLCDYDRNDVLYTIAHEFAHVYLGHRSLYCRTHKKIIEADADTLVMKWGFEGELRGAQWSYIFGTNTESSS